jgi:serine-type D-Ala-D-Ala carboxypeptidase/endopeptidase (penicillin-binding protein 4)
LVLVVDAKGNELVAQSVDELFVPASVTKILTAWLAMLVLGDALIGRCTRLRAVTV